MLSLAVDRLPGFLVSAVVCFLFAIYALIVLVAVFHPDQQRRKDARAVLRLHLQALRRNRPS